MNKLLISRKDFLQIWFGVTLMGFAITWFLSAQDLVIGGLSGVGIIIEELSNRAFGFGIPLWFTTLLFNIPLFAISIWQRGIGFATKSLYAVGLLSFSLWYMEYLPNIFVIGDDLLLTGVFGGVLLGIGIGMVLRASGTTGGTDMLASIIKFKHPKFPIAKLMLIIDGSIILGGFFIFGAVKAMYGIMSVVIISRAITYVLEGGHAAIAAFIISDHNEMIADAILKNIPRGSTGIKAKGMYSKEDKNMLFTVVAQKEVTKLREIIYAIDPTAFVTVTDVREVLGQGFIEEYNPLN